jgi:hypothetical protein
VVTGITPDRVTTDGHDSYPRAIRTVLGKGVRHRDSQYLNNWWEQDHRGVKGRYGPMRGFKCPRSAGRFCRAYDELRNFLRSRSRTNHQVSADYNLRAKVEASIGRYKRVIGNALRSRTDRTEATEVTLAAAALNRMLAFGRPDYVRIA